MKKGSPEAKAWGRKMKRLRKGKSTKKGQVRKTARRAYKGLKKQIAKRTKRYKKKSDNWSF